MVLVKWMFYPKKFNLWKEADTVTTLNRRAVAIKKKISRML